MASILVTGGAGFIGSHLVDKLIERGEKVIIIDNLSTGKINNINKKARFHHKNIQDKGIEKIFKEEKPRVIYHLAAQASVIKSLKDPVADADTNVLGTINILNNCVKYKVEKIVFSSTGGAIYKEKNNLPVSENGEIGPLSPYGQSKYVSEQYILLFNKLHKLPYLILRYGNVYGPRQDPSGEAGVIAIFIDNVLKKNNPTIFGDGNQTRDFLYVDDVVNANLQLKNGIFNIGAGKETTINKIASTIIKNLGSEITPVYDKARDGEIRNIYLNVEKAEICGWTYKTTLEEGIKKTIDYFKNVSNN